MRVPPDTTRPDGFRACADLQRVEVLLLRPGIDDFNTDLLRLGAAAFLQSIVPQLAEADRTRFLL